MRVWVNVFDCINETQSEEREDSGLASVLLTGDKSGLVLPDTTSIKGLDLRSLGVGGVRAPCRPRPRLKTDTRSTSLFYGAHITQELSRSLTQQTKKDR